jgi:thiol:disulfide interchange protein
MPVVFDRLRRGLGLIAVHIAFAFAALAFCPGIAYAVDEEDLLPVDRAFVLRAQATAADRIEVRWTIAPGYYLYRHRTKVQILDSGITAGALQLPKGEAHNDEFFGATETYRGRLLASLPQITGVGGRTLRLKIQYQGCADIGVCYPPQTRQLQVTMPAGAAAAGSESTGATQASPTSDRAEADEGFGALGRALGRSGTSNGISGGAPTSRLPIGEAGVRTALPEAQAFGFEAIAGDGNTLLLRFTPAKGYYLYRDRTTLRVRGSGETVTPGKIAWPQATPWHDEHFGTVQVFFSQIDARVPLSRSSAKALPIEVDVEFQGCQTDGICYPPMRRKVPLTLPAGAKIASVASGQGESGARDAQGVALPSPSDAIRAAGQARDAAPSVSGPDVVEPISNDGTDRVSSPVAGNATALAPSTGAAAAALTDRAPDGRISSLWFALLLAFLGGIVLNLMPCVLPVLSLKALGLAGSGEAPTKARAHALWYTAGVLVSFLALGGLAIALRQAGLALGWGFQLQQPLVVAALALVMFGFGLSLSGLWYVGGRWTGVGHGLASRSGAVGDFFTGVLAVVVAAPCTAPFMAQALGWAFTAPTMSALLVFAALGVGLAFPFLLIGFVPALARRLPKPGPWMETLKQFLAFPMYLTAIWLLWVLTKQRGADAGAWLAIAALALAFGAWAWRSRRDGVRWGTAALLVALVLTGVSLHAIARLPKPQTAQATETVRDAAHSTVAFSEQRLADLRRSGRVVLVNMTADWCITCKANEKAVFARASFRTALAQSDGVYVVGDWTDVDPAITAYLQRYRAVGVPLYVVYPRGGGEGRVLPTVLTPSIVEQALADAAKGRR